MDPAQGKVVLIIGIVKGVGFVLEQELVDVHPRAVNPGNRFGHERGVGSPKLGQPR